MRATEFLYESEKYFPNIIADILEEVPGTSEIWFHGSRAIGTHKKRSDWDILVVLSDKVKSGDEYFGVVRTLQKIASNYKNFDIQPSRKDHNIALIAKEEGRLVWSKKGKHK